MLERHVGKLFFILCVKCRWMVSLQPQPFYPLGNSHPYQLNKRLGGRKGHSRPFGKEKSILLLPLDRSLYEVFYDHFRITDVKYLHLKLKLLLPDRPAAFIM
jgi:hypothetical protein